MRILTVGGDLRLHFASLALSAAGYAVRMAGTPPTMNPFPTGEELSGADAWLLPLPVTRGRTVLSQAEGAVALEELAAAAREGTVVFGGRIPPDFSAALEKKGAEAVDYFLDPLLTLENAALTAEGAVYEWMRTSRDGLLGRSATVLGFGRIGKRLAALLCGMGVKTTVLCRKETDRWEAARLGCEVGHLSEGVLLPPRDAVFNTVPVRLLTPASFAESGTSTVFDLADGIPEAPGAAALVPLRGVPGRYAPREAGMIIARAVLRHLNGRGR
jgi:hypothetical protein